MPSDRLTCRLGVFTAALLLAGSAGLRAQGAPREQNGWPVLVQDTDGRGRVTNWTGAGPLLFGRMTADGGTVSGLRPLWFEKKDAAGKFRAGFFLYPVFSYRQDESTYRWNVLELVRQTGRRAGAAAPASRYSTFHDFEVWPFWFSRQTGDPAFSYRALFPVAGTVKDKLGFDRASWLAFPLYARTEKRGVVTTSVPWPFVRITSGAAHGFSLWPLFNWRERPGAYRQAYYLWPLGYDVTTYPAPGTPRGTPPTHEVGALPLYARRTAPGYIDQSFLWPFFGYTDQTIPVHYHERRYFWPLFVQSRGDVHYINRWGPFYTHSINQGDDKTWYLWPVVRREHWQERGLTITRTQLLYFVYWSEVQRSTARPNAPAAELRHYWPLLSTWSNGAGKSEWQFLSPLDVFFPGNSKMSTAWSPLFAIARHAQTAPGESRTSLFWNAITWRRDAAHHANEFHLGPLLSVARDPHGRRIALANGLVSFNRRPGSRWRIRWLDFHPGRAAHPSR